MHATDFGRTLIIANPVAQSGAAREVAERLQRFLDMTARASQFDLVLTERMGHAKELAARAQGYRTVIALGGDGVIHEVVNGLMTQKEDARPALAVLPVGSGNDFAQTLGIDVPMQEETPLPIHTTTIPDSKHRLRMQRAIQAPTPMVMLLRCSVSQALPARASAL